ncbi:MAG TPA: hypothetical protein VJH03_23125 [Blastocatellia bacterium]|nr:hypothetical protein [Blastocatellia bacterium]
MTTELHVASVGFEEAIDPLVGTTGPLTLVWSEDFGDAQFGAA